MFQSHSKLERAMTKDSLNYGNPCVLLCHRIYSGRSRDVRLISRTLTSDQVLVRKRIFPVTMTVQQPFTRFSHPHDQFVYLNTQIHFQVHPCSRRLLRYPGTLPICAIPPSPESSSVPPLWSERSEMKTGSVTVLVGIIDLIILITFPHLQNLHLMQAPGINTEYVETLTMKGHTSSPICLPIFSLLGGVMSIGGSRT